MKGQLYIFTGEGKGKTSAALGMLVRALVQGWRVGWISWYKEPSWGTSENHLADILTSKAKKRLIYLPMGRGFFLQHGEVDQEKHKRVRANSAVIIDDNTPSEHVVAAQKALEKAKKLMPKVDILFLDEICNALSDKLLKERAVLSLLSHRKTTHIVATGRGASKNLQSAADLVSVIRKEKHPFDSGRLAVKGLDF